MLRGARPPCRRRSILAPSLLLSRRPLRRISLPRRSSSKCAGSTTQSAACRRRLAGDGVGSASAVSSSAVAKRPSACKVSLAAARRGGKRRRGGTRCGRRSAPRWPSGIRRGACSAPGAGPGACATGTGCGSRGLRRAPPTSGPSALCRRRLAAGGRARGRAGGGAACDGCTPPDAPARCGARGATPRTDCKPRRRTRCSSSCTWPRRSRCCSARRRVRRKTSTRPSASGRRACRSTTCRRSYTPTGSRR